MDRSLNDIEVLTLILCLLMENPYSIHAIRGNHEDVLRMQQYDSFEPDFFLQNRELFNNCYKTFPLALCVGVKDDQKKSQYTFFSHALFSPAVDVTPLLEGDSSCMIVEEMPIIQERIYEHRDDETEGKQHRAFGSFSSQHLPAEMMKGDAFRWNVIGKQTGGKDPSGRYVLAPDHIHDWMRYVGVKHIIKGHEHTFDEIIVSHQGSPQHVRHKVIATTLPAGTATGLYGEGPKQTYQGMVLQVAQKVKDWKKVIAFQDEGMRPNVSLKAGTTCYPMYQAMTMLDSTS